MSAARREDVTRAPCGTTLRARGYDADLCRERGWGPGTFLVGDEGYGPTIIEITAVGQRDILAVAKAHDGHAVGRLESSWTLFCRDWQPIDPAGVPEPLPIGGHVLLGGPFTGHDGYIVRGPDISGFYRVENLDVQKAWHTDKVTLTDREPVEVVDGHIGRHIAEAGS